MVAARYDYRCNAYKSCVVDECTNALLRLVHPPPFFRHTRNYKILMRQGANFTHSRPRTIRLAGASRRS